MHRAREFGITIPEFDILRDRQLTKSHIKTILESLLTTAMDRKLVLPNPNSVTWDEFMKNARKMIESAPVTYCPLLQLNVPWVNLRELSGTLSNPLQTHTGSRTYTQSLSPPVTRSLTISLADPFSHPYALFPSAYLADPVTLIIDTNEALLYRIFAFYAVNASQVARAVTLVCVFPIVEYR